MKSLLKDWFSFSKKERLGIIALLAIIVFFIMLPELYVPDLESPKLDSSILGSLESNSTETIVSTSTNRHPLNDLLAKSEFYFDPNTLNEMGWQKLGINQNTIRTIINYRNKGGRFRHPTDIRKIWGLMPSDADRLIPFIQIADNLSFRSITASIVKPAHKKIEINTASAVEWEALPGIGPVLAKRILNYKEKLGGFKSIDQLRKTYGISDSVFNSIMPLLTLDSTKINQQSIGSIQLNNAYKSKDSILNINNATVAQLIHIGIDEGLAKAIVLYRKQYGNFAQLADLKQIVFISESVYQQIIPKLKVE
jgi:competence ComEA-like helix-hairpin-helix protein